jgi:nucleoside-diphosphate-sugar epimerase
VPPSIVDDLSSGKIENIQPYIDDGRVEFIHADLRQPDVSHQVVEDINLVFHLAADHGGRGYVDLHQATCATNLIG